MFLSQPRKLRPELGFFLFGHRRRMSMPLPCGPSGLLARLVPPI
jgi:hypothetical protein